MAGGWPIVALNDVLTRVSRPETVDPMRQYRQLGVRLDAGGPFLREVQTGSQIAARQLFRVATGDFIYSRLFAWRGAFGVIPAELDGSYVSGEFPTFRPIDERLDVEYLRHWFRTPSALEPVLQASSGSTPTTRNRLNERFFVALTIPLPPRQEQRRIVARIEEMSRTLSAAERLRKEAREASDAVLAATVSTLYSDEVIWRRVRDAISARKGAVRSGPFGSQLLHEEFVDHGVAAIGTRDVQVNRFTLTSGWFVTPDKFESFRRYQVFPGDILCTIVGASIGRFCVVPDSVPTAFTTKHVQALTLDASLALPSFVSWMLNFHRRCRRSLFSRVEGSAQPSLNADKVLSTELPIPPMRDQERVVRHLAVLAGQLSDVRQLQAAATDESNALLPSILDRAFKGEL